jgi:Peptidase_C39 like family
MNSKAVPGLVAAFVAIGAAVFVVLRPDSAEVNFASPPAAQQADANASVPAMAPSSTAPVANQDASLPRSVQIDVPFMSQAPFANWDDLHQEACEEMSFLLVKHYLEGTPVNPEIAERELQDMVAWMTANGYSYDVTAEQLAGIVEEKYGMNATVTYDITIDDIKRELAKGNPVILPLAGQRIGNPYFSGDGPPYHMLVVTGYDSDEFITNDVGTKRGEDFKYPQQKLFDAIHDWTGDKATIEEGRKAMLVVTK